MAGEADQAQRGALPGSELLTVLMPVFNGERFLAEQIESILGQSFSDFRLIIVDDGSSDCSLSIAERYAGSDSRVRVLSNSENLGVVRTVERLLGMVTTPYFSLADQDDVWHPDKLRLSLEQLQEAGADLVCTDLELVDAQLRPLGETLLGRIGVQPKALASVTSLLMRNFAVGCTLMGTRDLIRSSLPFPAGVYMHDWWLALVAAAAKKFVVIKSPLVKYRQHGTNVLGADTGIQGLQRRLRARGSGLAEHLRERLRVRLLFVDALRERSLCGYLCWALGAYWRLPVLGRLLLGPFYCAFIMLFAREAGWRTLVTDFLLTLSPAWIGRLVERAWRTRGL